MCPPGLDEGKNATFRYFAFARFPLLQRVCVNPSFSRGRRVPALRQALFEALGDLPSAGGRGHHRLDVRASRGLCQTVPPAAVGTRAGPRGAGAVEHLAGLDESVVADLTETGRLPGPAGEAGQAQRRACREEEAGLAGPGSRPGSGERGAVSGSLTPRRRK